MKGPIWNPSGAHRPFTASRLRQDIPSANKSLGIPLYGSSGVVQLVTRMGEVDSKDRLEIVRSRAYLLLPAIWTYAALKTAALHLNLRCQTRALRDEAI